MKKFTIEEKAQRYDEAINAIKELKAKHPTAHVIKDWIKENFPELAESEDERIRKKIIQLVNDAMATNAPYKKEMLAWLEEQGEHANFLDKIQVGDKVTRNEDGVLVNLSQLKRVAKSSDDIDTEKQGEQKPADLPNGEDYGIDGLYAAVDILQKTLGKVDGYQTDDGILEHKCAISAVKNLYEQKPAAWSEEDEKMLQGIWDEIIANKHDAKEYEWKTYDKFLDWLNFLKERVQPQPKQKWSEEDERTYKSITYSFAHNYPLTVQQQEFVKSLKDRYTWKPSDEQMRALEYIINNTSNTSYSCKIAKELLEQLKKLKGKEV